MTDQRKTLGDAASGPPPGLQLLGDGTAMGVCIDGVCAMPGAPVADSVAEKAD